MTRGLRVEAFSKADKSILLRRDMVVGSSQNLNMVSLFSPFSTKIRSKKINALSVKIKIRG